MQPGYEQKTFSAKEKQGCLRLVAAPEGQEGAVTIHQDAYLYSTFLNTGEAVEHTLTPDRCAYVQVARGEIKVNDTPLSAGDGARITKETSVRLEGVDGAEVLLFDLKFSA